MPNVLIRDVAPADLEKIRSAAAEQGTSLQGYLRDAVHAQAAYLRRQDALASTAQRLQGRPEVTDDVRDSVDTGIERSGAPITCEIVTVVPDERAIRHAAAHALLGNSGGAVV